jgi:monothiol glutaredoxin
VDVIERIKQQIGSNKILIYMKGTPDFPQCGFSARAVQCLKGAGAENFGYVNILEEPEIRARLKEYSNWPTFPQVFIEGELVGGCDITVEMYQSGELKKLVDKAQGRAA